MCNYMMSQWSFDITTTTLLFLGKRNEFGVQNNQTSNIFRWQMRYLRLNKPRKASLLINQLILVLEVPSFKLRYTNI